MKKRQTAAMLAVLGLTITQAARVSASSGLRELEQTVKQSAVKIAKALAGMQGQETAPVPAAAAKTPAAAPEEAKTNCAEALKALDAALSAGLQIKEILSRIPGPAKKDVAACLEKADRHDWIALLGSRSGSAVSGG